MEHRHPTPRVQARLIHAVSTNQQKAREAFGNRLREIRLDAGLSGRQLASITGFHYTKVSRVEHGGQSLSDADIRAWCAACGASSQATDLIAKMRPATSGLDGHSQTSFWIFDESLVQVETLTTGLDITRPEEIELYAATFQRCGRRRSSAGTRRRQSGEPETSSCSSLQRRGVERPNGLADAPACPSPLAMNHS